MADSLGIAIGHLYYFLEDVYPLMTPTRTRILKTPKIMYARTHNPKPNTKRREHTPMRQPVTGEIGRRRKRTMGAVHIS